jgi:tetratricopeptide (TPR) repeat protein
LAAQAHRLLGHIALDISHPRVALSAYEKALALREKFEEPISLAIAEVLDSIACSLTEIGEWEKALEQLHKAESITLACRSRKSARTEFIYSMTYLRANQLDNALDKLHSCWKLQGKTQEEIAQSKYPKHPGDIVLLARILYAKGTDEAKKEGIHLASQSISLRIGIFGAKGPRVADSMFLVSRMMAEQSEYTVAAKMLNEVVDMSRGMEEMQGQLVRALWFLASFEDKLNNPEAAEKYRKEAKEERLKLTGREVPDEDTDIAFLGLVSWILL